MNIAAIRLVSSVCALMAWASIASPVVAQEPEGTVRGIVRAVREAAISTDLLFIIKKLPFREGEAFKQGDIIATFDCADLDAELKAADARLRAETLTYENNMRLEKLHASGEFDVQLSKAKADQAAAEVEAYRSKLSRCSILAPFDGRIAILNAHEHEFPDRTQPLMRIVGVADLEIDMLLPATWLRWLKSGMPFDLIVEENGATLAAEVTRIAAVVDAVSQTVKVTGRFTGDTKGILPGMSGPTKFRVPNG